jgi:hypothetical protein
MHLSQYDLAPGYPAYQPHPRYLGELKGSWHDIGRQYGERAGDLIRFTFEGWYKEILAVQGTNQAIVDYLYQQDAYYSAFLPEALELMKAMSLLAGPSITAPLQAGPVGFRDSESEEAGRSAPAGLPFNPK